MQKSIHLYNESCNSGNDSPASVFDGFDSTPESSLDSIYGHLTSTRYVPVSRHGSTHDVSLWRRPSGVWHPGTFNYVAKVQRFEAGGYEITCRPIELGRLASQIDAPRKTGSRSVPAPREVDRSTYATDDDYVAAVELAEREYLAVREASQDRSIKRAKTTVRHKVKSIGADRLLTLTKREIDPATFWGRVEWLRAWDKFQRLSRRAGIVVRFVAVLEKHKKGNFHMHAAIDRHIPINVIRGMWWACVGGRGMGNVDVRFRSDQSPHERRRGVARYISKYITKGFDDECGGFNKKRYFASRHDLPAPERIILNAMDRAGALAEVADYMGLDLAALSDGRNKVYMIDSCDGFWFGFTDELVLPPPF